MLLFVDCCVFVVVFVVVHWNPVPLRCNGVVGTGKGVKLKAWSLESYIPPANACPGSHEDRGCYCIFHSRGFGKGEFTFWIQIEVNMNKNVVVVVVVITVYLCVG